MSRERGIGAAGWPLSAMLDWCKRMISRYWRFASESRMPQVRQFQLVKPVGAGQPLRVEVGGMLVDLKEFTKLLRIGDRVRVFCDDGVLVAEKVSHTRFKTIYAATVAKLVH